MKRTLPCLIAAGFILSAATPANAGWADVLDKAKQEVSTSSSASSSSYSAAGLGAGLSDSDIAGGLKEALAKGTTKAVASLGQNDGYFANQAVKILLPDWLKKAEGPLRLAGQGQLVDDFVLAMNRAAEKAVPQAAGILGDAVKKMTVSDAKGILTGGEDSATQYFRKTSGDKIGEMMKPIVAKSMENVGVAKAYKKLTANPLAAGAAQAYGMDLDTYVNDKAKDGLFYMIAQEEKDIRKNPAERTTSLLKKVFGSK